MRIAFLHPDLGLGGAERLVVDAAMAMKLEVRDWIVLGEQTIAAFL
jgi:alpha-1,3/alpha-1,6-mannosyltransferase